MDSFLNFFNKDSISKPSKSSRTHHQTTGRLSGSGFGNRKGINLVGKVHSKKLKNSTIDQFSKNKSPREFISKPIALQILKDFNLVHMPNQSYSKDINRTGIRIHFNPKETKWCLTKKGGKPTWNM